MKRIFDLTVSIPAFLVFLPILAIIAGLIRWKMGSPVLFRQLRPGMDAQPFEMFKFRTMRDASDQNGDQLSDAERLTKLGLFLRSSSLDELPGLWNVIKGEMSLVGPRPLLMEYLPLYSQEQSQRHDVRPGITGWAQVNGRNAISWEEKFEFDIWYVYNQNTFLDIKILFLTLKKVFFRADISADGEATMPKFRGGKGIR